MKKLIIALAAVTMSFGAFAHGWHGHHYHHHHGGWWGPGGCHFWPGFVGGVVGGAVTFASFKPCCDKLKASLRNTMLSNPNCSASQEDEILILDEVEDTSVEE